ncbi:MAG: tetratricopeptide repeat protein, partial [Bacteroidota bacterium]
MRSPRRGTGQLGLLVPLLLFGLSLFAQTPEALLEREEYAAAALAFAERGSRVDRLAAGTAWMEADSLARARVQFRLVTDGTADSLAGLAWHKIGLTYYQEADDAAAAAAYRNALAVRDSVFSATHLDRAHTRSNLASSLIYLGQTDSAGLLLREAIDIYATTAKTDTFNWILSLADLMQVSIELRDFRVGVSAAESALGLLATDPDISQRARRSILYRSASAYYHFGDLDRGERLALQMLVQAQAEADPYDVLQAYNLLMLIAEAAEQPSAYREYAEKALAIA